MLWRSIFFNEIKSVFAILIYYSFYIYNGSFYSDNFIVYYNSLVLFVYSLLLIS